jgi:hypothetical protein
MELLGAIAVVVYLIQFLLYSQSRNKTLGADLFDIVGLPTESDMNFGSDVEMLPAK